MTASQRHRHEPSSAALHHALPTPPAGWYWDTETSRDSRDNIVFAFRLISGPHDTEPTTARINVTRHGTTSIKERAAHLISSRVRREKPTP